MKCPSCKHESPLVAIVTARPEVEVTPQPFEPVIVKVPVSRKPGLTRLVVTDMVSCPKCGTVFIPR